MKRLFFKTTIENSLLDEAAMTTLRVVTGLLMLILHGMGKMPPSEKFIEGVTTLGFPAPVAFAWAAGIAESIGAIFLAIGLFTRPSAILLTITMIVAAFGRHLADPLDVKEKSLLYLIIVLVFVFRGAGRWSIDYFSSKNFK